ncbi:MAG TPA: Nramp family divalent metal transporter [Polyangia bacterium]
MRAEADAYRLSPEDIVEPPTTLREIFRRIGPGMILAASIVGSGELIATTTLGAQEGYKLLWLIILSCLVKPIIQAELGRYTIATAEPTLESVSHVPGPRLGRPGEGSARGRVGWLAWAWAIMVFVSLLQVGAMFGGLAQVMNLLIPAVPMRVWVVGFMALTLLLLLGGGYERIERLAFVKVGLFTLLTMLAALLVTRRPEFSWAQVGGGFTFDAPSAGLLTAVAVFGVTGVGTNELAMYPYWCVEKGYARFTGPRDGSEAWVRRARGWIRVMHIDILASLVIYTIATIAFYLLGAGVLNAMGLVPKGNDMIVVLSRIYTETLGPWALYVFYAGAIVTLYGTIFASVAGHSRVYTDLGRLYGLFARGDAATRAKHRRRWVWALTIVPVGAYFLLESPVKMVVFGATAQSVMLPVFAFATVWLRHRRLPGEVAPGVVGTVGLWVASLVVAVLIGVGLVMSARH